jgi:hypothetical protein
MRQLRFSNPPGRHAARAIAMVKKTGEGAIDVLRSARWVTRERLVLWGAGFCVLSAVTLTYVAIHTSPLAGDFINYWSGATLAASGRAPLAYNVEQFRAFERTIIGPPGLRWYSYPPIAMLLTLPLALFSFGPALALWLLAGAGSCFELARRLVGWRGAVIAVIGTPAAFFTLEGGQNSFFTASLLAGGLMVLNRRPVVAGICFGCLAYKPHLGLLLPIALAAGGYWRAFAAAAATVALLAVASLILFGAATWVGFLGQMDVERQVIEFETRFWPSMPTVFAAARILGATLPLAYGAQILSGTLAALIVGYVWRMASAFEIKAATLIAATFLATPHAWDYDLVVMIFAAAWLWREGRRTGFLAWERIAVVAMLAPPLFYVGLARSTGIPIGAAVLWLVLLTLARRGSGCAAAAAEDCESGAAPALISRPQRP